VLEAPRKYKSEEEGSRRGFGTDAVKGQNLAHGSIGKVLDSHGAQSKEGNAKEEFIDLRTQRKIP